MKQLDFKAVQGAGETRIAAALAPTRSSWRCPRACRGRALNAGNFDSAEPLQRRQDAPPLWRNFAGSLETIVPPLPGTRLWSDDRDIPFLAENIKDAADTLFVEAPAMRTLGDGGWDHDAVVDAVTSGDLRRLAGQHTGLVPVQLQVPGSAGAVAFAARTNFTPSSGDWTAAEITRGDLFDLGHPLVAAFPSLFEPVHELNGHHVQTWKQLNDLPALPALTGGQ